MPTEVASDFGDQVSPRRRLRVRRAYPRPLVDLATQLLHYFRPREIAALLDVPLSSVYRWHSLRKPTSGLHDKTSDSSQLGELVERCIAAGIVVPKDLVQRCATMAHTEQSHEVLDEKYVSHHAAGLPPAVERHRSFRRAALSQASSDIAERVERARQLILRDYFRDLDSTTLAGIAQMSRYHLIRVFGARFGTSPHQYLMQVRVDAAKVLLATSSETIDVIAVATGFRSASCLNRTFRRMEGKPPSDFYPVLKKRRAG